ncbi:hypothetical protein B0A50_04112 [Salinomyces thailandicus]|uniref:DUF7707 domain-containing protein n=1 Tax=Salinomyces thailandicus TaxID=706561 RepID=A0A4U0TZU4_9PEZI|nr:hypothetical protein B0A50_04112 [Salinomyces thailandica]
MKSTAAALLTASALLTSVSAQYTIDPASVSNSTRENWCEAELTQCPLICTQTTPNASPDTQANTCDPDLLTYACICSNGLSPNLTQYSQTLPFFTCQEWGNQCVSNCGGDNTCASDCRSNNPCGALDPVRVNTSTASSSMMSMTVSVSASGTGSAGGQAGATTGGDGGVVYTGLGGDSAASSTASGSSSGGAATSVFQGAAPGLRAAALGMGQTFGALGVMGLLFGGFAVLL